MQKKLCTLRPAFWPDLNYFWRIAQCDYVLLTDHLLYVKQTESTVSAPFYEEKQRLRIPVRHTGRSETIAAKKMDNFHAWRRDHLKALQAIFTSAPFAYLYIPQIKALYETEDNSLSAFLQALIQKQMEWLHIASVVIATSQLETAGTAETFIIRQCGQRDCATYLAEPAVFDRGWVDKKKLKQAGILAEPFRPMPDVHILSANSALAALSFLMQFGPEAGYLLRQFGE